MPAAVFAAASVDQPVVMPRPRRPPTAVLESTPQKRKQAAPKATPQKCPRASEPKAWAAVCVQETLTASGGECRGAVPLEPHQFPQLHPGARYLKMNQGEPWLMALAIGKVGRQEFLSRDTFVNLVKDKALAACEAEDKVTEMTEDVSAPAAPQPGKPDPMAAMMDDAPAGAVLAASSPKASRAADRSGPLMVQVEVPEECPVLHPMATATRTLSVIVTRSRRSTLFINLNDLDWIVRMVHDYWVCGNVALTEEENTDNVDKFVTGCRPCSRHEEPVAWNYQCNHWQYVGESSIQATYGPSQVTLEDVQKWGPESVVGKPLAAIPFETKRAIAKVVVETMIPVCEARTPPARVGSSPGPRVLSCGHRETDEQESWLHERRDS